MLRKGEKMEYTVAIDGFDGPLDLLWMLIQETKMDIYAVSISEITEQYLAIIKQMESIELEVASEYLYIASQLIEYKSRKLLPVQEDEEETFEDFRNQLIERLLQYKQFKETTPYLKQLEMARNLYFTGVPQDITPYQSDVEMTLSRNKSGTDLAISYVKVLRREATHKKVETVIQTEHITVEEQLDFLRMKVTRGQKQSFTELTARKSRQYRVTLFLAILQMCREFQMKVSQSEVFGEIVVERIGE